MIRRLLAVFLGILLTGSLPRMALANGGHIHIYGDVGIPTEVGIILGVILGLVFIWLITVWAVSFRRLKQQQGVVTPPEEEEDDHGLGE